MAVEKIPSTQHHISSDATLGQRERPETTKEMSAQQDRFRSLVDNSPSPIGKESQLAEGLRQEEPQDNPIFGHENVSAQKTGTATDQEQKRRSSHSPEEIEGVKKRRSHSPLGESGDPFSAQSSASIKEGASGGQTTIESLTGQTQALLSQIDRTKTQFNEFPQGGTIKSAYQDQMQKRLTHVDRSLAIALSKAGIEPAIAPPTIREGESKGNKGMNPIQRFIGLLTNSQSQIEQLRNQLNSGGTEGKPLSPIDLLAIQIKMNDVQQQMELFTNLLNKALESTKTLMNVQV